MNKYISQILIFLSIFLLAGCQQDKKSTPESFTNPISEDVTFSNVKASVELAGTLTLPDKEGQFPTAILISGNGEHDRNESFGNHKPFLDISNYFAKNGIATFRYDKRGVEKSTGDYNAATSFDFAEDVKAAVDYLLSRKEVQSIGLIGHSEGGLIAPIVASTSPKVAFIIALAGPSIAGDKILLSQQKAIALAKGRDEADIKQSQKLNRDAFEIVKKFKEEATLKEEMTSYIKRISLNDPDQPESMTFEEYVDAQVNGVLRPWMVNFLRYNPAPFIQQVKCPVLALNGSKDLQVLAKDNLPEWKRILEESGNENVAVKELANLNHLFQNCETGLPDEYQSLGESFAPSAMEEMTQWIKRLK